MKFSSIALMSLALAATSASSAFAATTGTLSLSGVVPAVTAVVLTPQAAASNLDLATGATNLMIATATEANNTQNGYTLKIASANSGLLKNGTLGSVTYTARYGLAGFTLSSTPVTVINQASQSAIVSLGRPLDISFAGTAPINLMAGTYSDTLTFTITAN
ncbi:hypothetical protein WDW37_21340 [Bdellovibrionota bacterium FG-1]